MHDETGSPHSRDVIERETSDNGFSRGWGQHFHPTAEYYADMHGHFYFPSFDSAEDTVRAHLGQVEYLDVRRLVGCTPITVRQGETGRQQGFDLGVVAGWESVEPYLALARKSKTTDMMLFLHHDNPDLWILRQSIALGACAVKLHNAPILVEGGDPNVWLSAEWAAVFREIQAAGLPVLWHVTQRLTDSPYTGGGRAVYWQEGWKKGVSYTNADLMSVFLKTVETYPGIPFIGAHQLHLGWESLDALFHKHPNLSVDTSIGCFVQPDDILYDCDRDEIRDFCIRHSGRVLFGTDYYVTNLVNRIKESARLHTAGHIRFIKQLRLPEETLQSVSHGNAERLMKLTHL